MRTPSRHLRRSVFLIAVFLLFGVARLVRAGSFTEVVDNATSGLPSLGTPSNISSDGTAVAFTYISNTDGQESIAIYYVAGPGGTPLKIADLQTTSPSGGGNFTELFPPVVSGKYVIFMGKVQNNQTTISGIYLADTGNSAALSIIADDNTTNPLDPTGSLTGDSKLGGFNEYGYDINGSTIVFTASDNVFQSSTGGGSPTPLLPLNPLTPSGIPFAALGPVKFQNTTYAVAGAGDDGNEGLYVGSLSGGPLRTVIDPTVAEPTGKGNFVGSYVLEYAAFALSTDGSDLAFVGDVTANGSNEVTGLYYASTSGGAISTVILSGTSSPDGGTFGMNFGGIYIEAQSTVDFYVNTGVGTGGIFVSGPDSLNESTVIADGASLAGSTVDVDELGGNGGSGFGFIVSYPTSSSSGATYAIYTGTSGGTQYQTPAFFTGQVSVGSGVYYLSFLNGNYFGYYSFLTDPHYIYHFDLGYEYVFDANDGNSGVYFYDFESGDFFYSSPIFPFPYLYDFGLNSVLYYYPETSSSGHYTSNPRYFFDFATGQIITR